MKRILMTILLCAALAATAAAQNFGDSFEDRTLRLDYIFAGNADTQMIALDELAASDGWAGRRVNLGAIPVRGNGEVRVTDPESGSTLYRTSFSSLFQE